MQDYQLLDQVGEGSFGRVFKARKKYTSMIVAIKMINKVGQTSDDLTSFRREIDILRRVDHPHIMRMIDVFETDTEFCVVSEFGCGDLFQAVQDRNLSERSLRNIAAQLVSALCYLHDQHIIHRDLKPQNVLIVSKKIVKICDFGFARALSTTTLVLTSIKGTPLYMAPELVQEHPYDEKVDVWSLGVILFELFFGTPPFVASSLYKLIPMIIGNPVIFPGPISEKFKSFLTMMLQKDPKRRASCKELQSHPFISKVKLSKFVDTDYIIKKKMFDEALSEAFTGNSFSPSRKSLSDPLLILKAPYSYTDDKIFSAIFKIQEKNCEPDSPLVAAFISNFNRFIQKPKTLSTALATASFIMKKDPSFSPKFISGIEILGIKNLPMSSVEFYTYSLCIPYAENMVNNKKNKIDLKLDSSKSKILRDILLGFLFTPDSVDIGEIYSFISFLAQNSEPFLLSIEPSFVANVTSVVIMHPSPLVKAASLCIIARIVSKNKEATQYILPKKQFLEALKKLISINPGDIPLFCVFSSVLSFFSLTLQYFDDFEFDLNEIFKVERVRSLLNCGSYKPTTEAQLLSYISIIASPFTHIPLTNQLNEVCMKKIESLLPFHQKTFLKRFFKLPFDQISPLVSKYVIPLIENPSMCDYISNLMIDIFKKNTSKSASIATDLVDNDILIKMSNAIKSKNDPNSMYVLFALVIASFSKPYQKLIDQAPIYLEALLSSHSSIETSLSVSSHLAKLSHSFIRPIFEYGGLIVAEVALRNPSGVITTRASILIGNICRQASLPSHSAVTIIPLLLEQMRSTLKECPRWATYAVGNAIFQNPDLAEYLIHNISPVVRLLRSKDLKTIENVAGILGNIVKKSDKFLNDLIHENVLLALVDSLDSKTEIAEKMISPISTFCQYEEARNFLKKINAAEKIQKFSESSNENVQKAAQSILKCLE